MTLLLNQGFEGGVVGQAMTQAQMGSSQAPSGVGFTCVASPVLEGTKAARTVTTAATNSYARYDIGPVASGWLGVGIYLNQLPGGGVETGYLTVLQIENANTSIINVRMDETGTWQIRDSGISRWTSPTAQKAQVGHYYEVRVFTDPGDNGRIKIYDATTGTLISDSTSVTVTNAAVTTVDNIRIGSIAGALRSDMVYDRLLFDDATEPARMVTTSPLVPNAGADLTKNAGSGFILTATASGGIAPYTYSWAAVTTGAPALTGSGASRSGTANNPSVNTAYTYRVTVTDSATPTPNVATDDVILNVVASPTDPVINVPAGWGQFVLVAPDV